MTRKRPATGLGFTMAPKPGARPVGVIRVSTKLQAEEGLSLEAQTERVRAYCRMRNLGEPILLVDRVTSKVPLTKRKEGRRVDELVAKGEANAVITIRLDRAFRNAVECMTAVDAWNRAGVGFHILDIGGDTIDTTKPSGRLFLLMLAGFAQMERETTSERTKEVTAHIKAKGGKYTGTPPVWMEVVGAVADAEGKMRGGALQLHPSRAACMAVAASLHADAHAKFTTIARWLDSTGFGPPSGGKWAPNVVRRALLRWDALKVKPVTFADGVMQAVFYGRVTLDAWRPVSMHALPPPPPHGVPVVAHPADMVNVVQDVTHSGAASFIVTTPHLQRLGYSIRFERR